MPERIKLTEKVLRDAEPVPGRDYQIFDADVRGLPQSRLLGLRHFADMLMNLPFKGLPNALALTFLQSKVCWLPAPMLGANSIQAGSREPNGRGPVPRSWPKLLRCRNSLTPAPWGELWPETKRIFPEYRTLSIKH